MRKYILDKWSKFKLKNIIYLNKLILEVKENVLSIFFNFF